MCIRCVACRSAQIQVPVGSFLARGSWVSALTISKLLLTPTMWAKQYSLT